MQKKREEITMDIRQKTVNTIRTLAADTVQKAKSGHPTRLWAWLPWPMLCG